MATALEMIAGGLALIVFGLICGEGHRLAIDTISRTSWLAFIYLIIFGSLIGFTTYIWLLNNTSLAVAGTYAYVNPLVALFLGCALGGEILTFRIIVAGIIILAAIALISKAEISAGSEA